MYISEGGGPSTHKKKKHRWLKYRWLKQAERCSKHHVRTVLACFGHIKMYISYAKKCHAKWIMLEATQNTLESTLLLSHHAPHGSFGAAADYAHEGEQSWNSGQILTQFGSYGMMRHEERIDENVQQISGR
jgi:hypothetical protein